MFNEHLKIMKDSYGYLFEIENLLRKFVGINMNFEFGVNWIIVAKKINKNNVTKKDFHSLNFHELITYIGIFECLSSKIPNELLLSLKGLTDIRNKIAHNIILNIMEAKRLHNIYEEVIDHFNIMNFESMWIYY
ncbi:hypothetical protein [Guptibacillus hwajinpoensis]|uniref:hypothetical protein n=1 Tax=Guptibacillus hwajinpoensis TaxID=208199 RepID=UPI003CFE9B48